MTKLNLALTATDSHDA